MINRLFILKLSTSQLKTDSKKLGKELEERFKGKITNLVAGITLLCCAGIAFLMARKNKRKNKA